MSAAAIATVAAALLAAATALTISIRTGQRDKQQAASTFHRDRIVTHTAEFLHASAELRRLASTPSTPTSIEAAHSRLDAAYVTLTIVGTARYAVDLEEVAMLANNLRTNLLHGAGPEVLKQIVDGLGRAEEYLISSARQEVADLGWGRESEFVRRNVHLNRYPYGRKPQDD